MKLLVLFGGLSSEHEVSRMSAVSIVRNADQNKYELVLVGITKEGRWLLYEGADPEKMLSGEWEQECVTPAMLSPDRTVHGLMVMRPDGVETVRIDCCFPVLHGFGGEDGTIQGLLTLAGIPFVGPGVAASADAMDKSITKILAATAGVRQADYVLVRRLDFAADADGAIRGVMEHLRRFPVFIKPCSSGSSVGVHRAENEKQLREGLTDAFRWDEKVLVEEAIDGREIEVAVLGNEQARASVAGEIAPAQVFYTYEAKYQDASSALYIPARISEGAMARVREAAVKIYRALDCRGLSRVDFFCTWKDEEIIFNEINTIPGFTSISMYPKLFQQEGLSYSALIDALIDCAMEGTHAS